MGSVETITVLIADLVGPTGLETGIEPSPAGELRTLLRGVIDEAGPAIVEAGSVAQR
jgi:hypothetical protein